VNSAAGRDEIVARGWLPASRVEVIYNGVDVDRFADPRADGKGVADVAAAAPRTPRGLAFRRALGIPDDHVAVVSLSRIDRHKGQLVEMAAASESLARHPNVHFLFVGAWGGGPEYRAEVEAARRALPDSQRVHFVGERDDVPAVLEGSDILIRVTTAEGLPNAVLEAMAAGRPVVASRVAGTPEAVADGETGVLVDPERGDQVVAALDRLVPSAEVRRSMGLAGRARVERLFRLESTIDAYERLFERESE
jgi:glycosyltransferase involved in cell wall biosynthesis